MKIREGMLQLKKQKNKMKINEERVYAFTKVWIPTVTYYQSYHSKQSPRQIYTLKKQLILNGSIYRERYNH